MVPFSLHRHRQSACPVPFCTMAVPVGRLVYRYAETVDVMVVSVVKSVIKRPIQNQNLKLFYSKSLFKDMLVKHKGSSL